MKVAITAVGSKSSYIDKTLKNTEYYLNEIPLKTSKQKESINHFKIYLMWIIMFSKLYKWVTWEIITVIAILSLVACILFLGI